MNAITCYCKQVSESEIEATVINGAKTLKDIQEMTSACTGNQCKELNPKGVCCSDDIMELLPDQSTSCNCCCG